MRVQALREFESRPFRQLIHCKTIKNMEQEINQQQFNRSEQKSGEKIKKLIFTSIISSVLGVLIAGGAVYFVLSNSYSEKQIQLDNKTSALHNQIDSLTEKQVQLNNQISTLQDQVDSLKKQNETLQPLPTPTQTQSANNQNTVDWKTYENKEIGLSFKYPASYGDFQISISNGWTGKIFKGNFQNNEFFSIGGITADYTEGRGAYFLDFVKYLYEGEKYYHLMALDKRFLIEPTKTLSVDGQKVLIVNDNSYIEETGAQQPSMGPGANEGALVNLPGGASKFEGLAIRNSTLPQSDFEEILTTLRFAK